MPQIADCLSLNPFVISIIPGSSSIGSHLSCVLSDHILNKLRDLVDIFGSIQSQIYLLSLYTAVTPAVVLFSQFSIDEVLVSPLSTGSMLSIIVSFKSLRRWIVESSVTCNTLLYELLIFLLLSFFCFFYYLRLYLMLFLIILPFVVTLNQ